MPLSRTVRFAYAFALVFPLALAHPASAQPRKPAPPEAAPALRDVAAPPAVSNIDAEDTRRQFEDVLKAYPTSLPRILRMDPTLLDNAEYLQTYPALVTFLAQHPEIRHNTQYFFGRYGDNQGPVNAQDRAIDMWRNTVEGFTIGTVVLLITSGVVWLIKTLIDQRRWSRLSKVQTEVHTKILDRFSSNEDLLAYIQTPAGRRFLESTPISIDAPRALAAPISRILWSAQAGSVLTVLGIGITIVSRTTLEEVAPPLAAVGAVIVALGIGFLVSSALAYTLTRRFKLMPEEPVSQEPRG
ncbi:MAG TPA: hypothetical protein VGI12_03805 [Vicinamibacterales bacterium]|jgi:hypothetical protein